MDGDREKIPKVLLLLVMLLEISAPKFCVVGLAAGWFQVKGADLWGVGFKSVFFCLKLVSWTAWEALMPILALLGPFRCVFGPGVVFGVLWGTNFWNNQMDQLFVILLFFLHLNSWTKYSFDVPGPNLALNIQNWPKMAKIGYSQIPIFQENITSKIDENALKYMSRTNLHFDIGLGWYIPENFFTTAKLKFLVPLTSPLEETDPGARWRPGMVLMALKQFPRV